MNEKLKYFTYSQNSLNTYKSCPFKFKYKYMDNINWKYDDVESREYYDSLKVLMFHNENYRKLLTPMQIYMKVQESGIFSGMKDG